VHTKRELASAYAPIRAAKTYAVGAAVMRGPTVAEKPWRPAYDRTADQEGRTR
jgi:hypothetical protein